MGKARKERDKLEHEINMERIRKGVLLEKDLKERMTSLGMDDYLIKSLYNVRIRKIDEQYVAVACQHWTWDFFVGIGDIEDDALKNMKRELNAYDKEFANYKYNFQDI